MIEEKKNDFFYFILIIIGFIFRGIIKQKEEDKITSENVDELIRGELYSLKIDMERAIEQIHKNNHKYALRNMSTAVQESIRVLAISNFYNRWRVEACIENRYDLFDWFEDYYVKNNIHEFCDPDFSKAMFWYKSMIISMHDEVLSKMESDYSSFDLEFYFKNTKFIILKILNLIDYNNSNSEIISEIKSMAIDNYKS